MKFLIVLLISIVTCVSGSTIVPSVQKYCEFSSEQKIIEERIIKDFDDNEFKLYELESGYAIYGVFDNKETFIEGSYETHSPYKFYKDYELRYLGPGNYFYINQDKTYDILEQCVIEDDLQTASYLLNEKVVMQTKGSSNKPDPNETTTDTNGYTVVKRAQYFKNLTAFPQNWFGECGLVALSIMLSYYDTFYNDNFIPNNKEYDARYYIKKTRSGGSDYELDYTRLENLTKFGSTNYNASGSYSYANWSKMPGTTYAMRDYLFDKYMHTFAGVGWESKGYPMLDGELASTLKDYMKDNCSSLQKDIKINHGSLFYTHARPKEYINKGLPTCLVLQKYNATIDSGKAHVVVAYGHKDDKFLAHFGWWPGDKSSAAVVINSATIYGYFTIEYTGQHVHSSNVRAYSNGQNYGICGCGYSQAV
ncbi:MAG: hypothetical protein SO434_07580 [Eubacteriales bacterium]|nr:hypothetical protein [Eubacteriales bacterium]